MSDTVVLDGTCTLESRLDGTCSLNSLLDGSAISVLKVNDYQYYTGSYEVTPTQETQTLNTANLMMSENVVINPIPSNYGLITWNGSTLTVS